MARPKMLQTAGNKAKSIPATSPEAQEKKCIALAYSLAEERLRNGTATSQEVVHFLRLGSAKEKKELEMIEKKNELMTAKTEALQSAKRIEALYADAINAFKSYRPPVDEDEFDDPDIY